MVRSTLSPLFGRKTIQALFDMINAEKFSSLLHDPAEKLIETYKAEDLMTEEKMEFYDLGPGLPSKSRSF